MKAISILSFFWFAMCLICILTLEDSVAQIGWGILSAIGGFLFSIIVLVISSNNTRISSSNFKNLLELNELKEKGILSEEEFQKRRTSLL